MATTNAGNSQGRDGKPRFRTDKPQGERRTSGDFKGKSNFSRNRDDSNSKGRDDFRGKSDFKGKGEYKPRGDFKGKPDFKSRGTAGRSFDRTGGFNKDKDEDDKPIRRPKQTKTDGKPKEQQPDKFEIINRLEKEKKAMKKKSVEAKKDNKPQKHQAKPKRSGNVDWTREYENGSYDDDDLDMYY